jgi:hypothetical protein
MDRRAFLSLGRRGRERVLELSCERLHVRWVDALGRSARTGSGDGRAPEGGEPPTRVAAETTDDLLAELDERLRAADVLRVVGDEWLQGDDLHRSMRERIASFEGRGGRVEHPQTKAPAAVAWLAALALLVTAPAAVDAQHTPTAWTPTSLYTPALEIELPDQTQNGRSAGRTIAIHGLVGTGAGLLIGLVLSSADISDDKTASVLVWTSAGAASGILSGLITWLMEPGE